MTTQNQVIDYVKHAQVGQLRALITALEEELGVSAAVPRGVVLPPVEPEPDQTEFDVVLIGYDGKKLEVIRAVRQQLGLGLREARDAVENAPSVLRSAISRQVADELAAELHAASATVEIR